MGVYCKNGWNKIFTLLQIDGHGDYIKNLDMILKAVGVRTMDEVRSTPVSKSSSAASVKASSSTNSIQNKDDKSIPGVHVIEQAIDVVAESDKKANRNETDTVESTVTGTKEIAESVNVTENTSHNSTNDGNSPNKVPESPEEINEATETRSKDSAKTELDKDEGKGIEKEQKGDVGDINEEKPTQLTDSEDKAVKAEDESNESLDIGASKNGPKSGKRHRKLNKETLTQMKSEVKDSVTDAFKCVKSNVKSSVKEKLRRKDKRKVGYKTASGELTVDSIGELKAKQTRNLEGDESDDDEEEGCYFTDSNPEDEDEEVEEKHVDVPKELPQ